MDFWKQKVAFFFLGHENSKPKQNRALDIVGGDVLDAPKFVAEFCKCPNDNLQKERLSEGCYIRRAGACSRRDE